jgi:hypothetical protein
VGGSREIARGFAVLPRLMARTRQYMDGHVPLAHGTNVNRGIISMFWAAATKQAAYDQETVSMLSSVLERAVAALPDPQRTEERKARLASGILAAAARGERDPIRLYAIALGGGPWEPSIGGSPPTSPPVWHRP